MVVERTDRWWCDAQWRWRSEVMRAERKMECESNAIRVVIM